MSITHLDVTPLDATFGATVRGIELAEADERAIETIRQLWLEHALLIFPGQDIDRDQQNEFARHFGELEFPAAPLSNLDKEGRLRPDDGSDDMVKILRGNMGWNMDSTYMAVRAKGAVFIAHVVPNAGGETGWADARDAYDTLDPATKAQIADLRAHHSLYHSQALIGDVREGESAGYGFFGQDPAVAPAREASSGHGATGAGRGSSCLRHPGNQ